MVGELCSRDCSKSAPRQRPLAHSNPPPSPGPAYCAGVLNDENRLAGVICRQRRRRQAAGAIRRDGYRAPRGRDHMRIPQQVSERVKEAPAQALRAVFSGIGQVLLVADRIKSRAAEPSAPAAPRSRVPAAQRRHRGRDQVAVARRDRERQAAAGRTAHGQSRAGPDQRRPTPRAPKVTEASDVAEAGHDQPLTPKQPSRRGQGPPTESATPRTAAASPEAAQRAAPAGAEL